MIITLTLNPSIDRTVLVDNMELNRVLKAQGSLASAGGKGINVSRALKRLGVDSLALTLCGGETGKQIEENLKKETITHNIMWIKEQSRNCYGIIDSKSGAETVINEYGPVVSEQEIEKFIALFESLVKDGDYISISGSAARGFSEEIYKDIIIIAKKANTKVLLDTSGVILEKGVQAKPFMVKINRNEMENLAGKKLSDNLQLIAEMEKLQVESVVVTNGENETLALMEGKLYMVTPPQVKTLNSWGSGDSVMAGILYGLSTGLPFHDTIKLAMAAGTANTLTYGAAFIEKEKVFELATAE